MLRSLVRTALLATLLVAIVAGLALAQESAREPWRRSLDHPPYTTAVQEAPRAGLPAQRPRRPNARRTEEIERTIEILALEAGDVVAEIGAGNGRYSLRFAEVVGPGGRVYANELDSSALDGIRQRGAEGGLDNLVAVQGAVDDTNLPDACCDAIMMRMVYHMMTDPVPMSRSFFRALKPGGLLVILEGDPKPDKGNADGVPANRAGMGIDPQIVIDELFEVGFEVDRFIADWTSDDYALVFHRSEIDRDFPTEETAMGTGPDGLRITVTAFDELARDDAVLLIDVRSSGAFGRDHLPGAQSVPLGELEEHLAELVADGRTIVTYCD